ncbi:hypothetical protein AVEN_16864-1 [Araneus ventricosus]|uniref:Uncharacterized protein n=1 Tax=Araneus ventricosus TaxID=182803 RepID=A0A4Y2V0I4_ARAVE|nr:hypothetical protein AVEN_16864-1 [Araneus ventricosus]
MDSDGRYLYSERETCIPCACVGPTTPVVASEIVSLTCTVEGSKTCCFHRGSTTIPRVEPTTTVSGLDAGDATYRTSSTLVS